MRWPIRLVAARTPHCGSCTTVSIATCGRCVSALAPQGGCYAGADAMGAGAQDTRQVGCVFTRRSTREYAGISSTRLRGSGCAGAALAERATWMCRGLSGRRGRRVRPAHRGMATPVAATPGCSAYPELCAKVAEVQRPCPMAHCLPPQGRPHSWHRRPRSFRSAAIPLLRRASFELHPVSEPNVGLAIAAAALLTAHCSSSGGPSGAARTHRRSDSSSNTTQPLTSKNHT